VHQDVVFSAAYSGTRAPYSPAAFLYAWWRQQEHSHLAGYQQQDAHEFYLYALAGLSHSRLPPTAAPPAAATPPAGISSAAAAVPPATTGPPKGPAAQGLGVAEARAPGGSAAEGPEGYAVEGLDRAQEARGPGAAGAAAAPGAVAAGLGESIGFSSAVAAPATPVTRVHVAVANGALEAASGAGRLRDQAPAGAASGYGNHVPDSNPANLQDGVVCPVMRQGAGGTAGCEQGGPLAGRTPLTWQLPGLLHSALLASICRCIRRHSA